MRQQIIVSLIIALFGVGVGVGGGVLITKSKVDKSNAIVESSKVIIADLQSEMKKSEIMWQQRNQKANSEIIRLNNELMRVNTELEQFKNAGTEAVAKNIPSENTDVKTAAVETLDNTKVTATVEYIVKDDDSFWKIAASQLGDGNRYKEIEKLNPNVSSENLAVGTKLKIPAR